MHDCCPALELREAAVKVGGRTLWSGVNARVEKGEFVAVLGPNGIGKSTLLKVLLGRLKPEPGGEVEVLGTRPGRAGDRIGYVPQRRGFDPSLRVRGIDIVRLGLDGDRWGVPLPPLFPLPGNRRRARTASRQVAEVIETVGASAYAHHPIGACSGGEQQRLLIAQALVRRPELLLLDEPLDSLDLPNQSAVAALVGRICHEHGVAVMMVAHDVNPILHHLDKVVYLAEGGAVSGRPDDVITGPTLSRLYRTPVEVLRTAGGRLVVVGGPDAPALHEDRHGPLRGAEPDSARTPYEGSATHDGFAEPYEGSATHHGSPRGAGPDGAAPPLDGSAPEEAAPVRGDGADAAPQPAEPPPGADGSADASHPGSDSGAVPSVPASAPPAAAAATSDQPADGVPPQREPDTDGSTGTQPPSATDGRPPAADVSARTPARRGRADGGDGGDGSAEGRSSDAGRPAPYPPTAETGTPRPEHTGTGREAAAHGDGRPAASPAGGPARAEPTVGAPAYARLARHIVRGARRGMG